jgi:ABC-type antimicrobial peptide transport system permease subunit
MLLAAFAFIALTLAAVGVHGVLAYRVAQRRREIGIRLALGARSGDVLRMVVGDGLVLAAAGVVLGAAGALALTRLMSSLLFQVTPRDPVAFLVAPLVLGTVAAVASWLPARLAAALDPVATLKEE